MIWKQNIDELIYEWYELIKNKEYSKADEIRDYLDTKHVFCFTTPTGYEVYHRTKGDRKDMINEIQRDIRSEKAFDAYLHSVRNSRGFKELCG